MRMNCGGPASFVVYNYMFSIFFPSTIVFFLRMFVVTGALIYVDPGGAVTGYDDVFTKLEKARDWYEECGLGRDYAEQFIR